MQEVYYYAVQTVFDTIIFVALVPHAQNMYIGGEDHDWTTVYRAGRSVINVRELNVEPPSGADRHDPLIYSLGDRYEVQ